MPAPVALTINDRRSLCSLSNPCILSSPCSLCNLYSPCSLCILYTLCIPCSQRTALCWNHLHKQQMQQAWRREQSEVQQQPMLIFSWLSSLFQLKSNGFSICILSIADF